jgi:predicted DNA-binding transcriptional regulator AlpA
MTYTSAEQLLPHDLIEPSEVAQRLGVTPQSLLTWRRKAKGPRYIKIGGRIKYPLSGVKDWLASRMMAA